MVSEVVDSNELSAFVASTLKAIAAGVREAKSDTSVSTHSYENSFEIPDSVAFDIAVTAGRVDAVGGGFKIQIASMIGGQASAKRTEEDRTVSRIAFSVPWKRRSTLGGPLPMPKTGIV